MKYFNSLFWLSCIFAGAPILCAGEPTEHVKATTDRIIGVMKNSRLAGEANKPERRRLIVQEIDQRFDWQGIARGSLGRSWSKATPEQRTEFLDLFRQFLEGTYLDKIEPYYAELSRIDYQGERIVDNYASVKTLITTKQNVSHPVEYRLERSAGQWKVYDAVIEGVSLVKNYRVQFDEIITKSSFNDLLKDLRAKVESTRLEGNGEAQNVGRATRRE
jgi:phospholipid transport system substrate-binding protein